ncbi:hypothetical protein PYCCODRAFT_1479622 [Trametes coccinea BRFM310]|uniref:Uncharacterized protein n=1 Tax=Trametes coccinea (strain BRFM310) TaxID=1353009 RepID=A0A1Y2IIR3_TRAC3|nr:hypothetical protein PYCCODRAFT_1479622 [Trametes coccinea BRFM310]
MAVAAQCANCANDPPQQPQPPPSLGVILGVLGGCALVAIVVAIVVPVVRTRIRRKGSILSAPSLRSYRRVRDADLEQDRAGADENARGLYLPSRRSSIRHQKMSSGPDARPFLLPLLLDPLKPISALTWSDLRSRTGTSTSSDSLSIPMADDDDPARTERTASTSTNRATTSHRSASTRSSTRDRQHVRYDELGRPVISDDAPPTRPALPSPQRSPTPPGLPSKREHGTAKARRASLPLPITPTSPSDPSQPRVSSGMPLLYAPTPAPASTSATAAGATALSRYPSGRPRTGTQKPGMEPVLEDAAADAYAETRSLQLPSPPASPEQPQPHWRPLPSIPLAPPSSSSSTSRRRPSLTTAQSAPTTATMPHRPRSSTGPAIPLTAAFQTSVLRSSTHSSATSSTTRHRYPSIVTSPPPGPSASASGRTRPSSVSVTMTSGSGSSGYLSPESPEMPRPTDAFRRMSTTDIRHRRTTHQHHDQAQSGGGASAEPPQAFLRSTDAARTTQVQPGGFLHGPRAATTTTTTTLSPPGPSFTTPPPHPLSPPALAPTPPRLQTPAHPPVRTHTGSVQLPPPHQGPALVRRKDSPALRPLPVSALIGGPGGSGVAGMSLGGAGSRSRSNSVRSTRTGPPVQLPPLDPVTPLTLSLKGSSEEGGESGR